jgi:putative ABC transport system ATP-binding protein
MSEHSTSTVASATPSPAGAIGGSAPGPAAAKAVAASKIYGSGDTEVHALREVSVDFQAGRFTAIMGPSGSGKSTLMHCMAGLDRLTSGEAWVGDAETSTLNDKELTILRREKIGFIFQAFNLVPTLTARENVTLPLDLGKKAIDEAWVDEVLATVGLADRATHRPNELSGGQQQRVAVARALATRPDIVFGDEPTGNLDSTTSAEILDFMKRAVQDLGQTMVMVTHDPVAASYADRVLFLADGRIVRELFDPTPDTVLDSIRGLGG